MSFPYQIKRREELTVDNARPKHLGLGPLTFTVLGTDPVTATWDIPEDCYILSWDFQLIATVGAVLNSDKVKITVEQPVQGNWVTVATLADNIPAALFVTPRIVEAPLVLQAPQGLRVKFTLTPGVGTAATLVLIGLAHAAIPVVPA